MESKIIGIYSIVNQVNSKKYIGSSSDVSYRFKKHLSRLKNKNHTNSYLQNAVNKYGINNFVFQILEEVEVDELLKKEQEYIDKEDWNNLYNLTKIAGCGGGDVTRKPLYLLNLDGSIYQEFESGTAISKFLGYKRLDYPTINTEAIKRKKYRVVTPDFYKENLDLIKSWNNFSNKSELRTQLWSLDKYSVIKDGVETCFNTKKSLAEYMGMSHQRITQIFKYIDTQQVNKYFHKKTSTSIQYVKKSL